MLIGLTTETNPDTKMIEINSEYVERVQQAGGTPVLIPTLDNDRVCEVLEHLSGVVIIGGEDISPALYSKREDEAEYHPLPIPGRDHFECVLVRKAHERDIPCLGVCRGMQIMNVAMGGTLYGDLSEFVAEPKRHLQQKPFDALAHPIHVEPDSQLATILHEEVLEGCQVNSIHHQAVRDLGAHLRVNAYSDDGVVEGVEDASRRFFLGVQWHPEYLDTGSKVFEAFIQAAKK